MVRRGSRRGLNHSLITGIKNPIKQNLVEENINDAIDTFAFA